MNITRKYLLSNGFVDKGNCFSEIYSNGEFNLEFNFCDGKWIYRDYRNIIYGIESTSELDRIVKFCEKNIFV